MSEGKRMKLIHVNHGKDENRPAWQHRKVVAYGENWEGSMSWNLFGRHGFGLGFQVGINGSESDIGLDIYLGRLLSVWTRFRAPFTSWLRLDRERHGYEPRHFGIRLFAVKWLSIECFAPAHLWSRSEPWWYRLEFGRTELWGRRRLETETLDSGVTRIPMPEGNYNATWKKVRTTSRHVRFPGTLRDRLFGVKVNTYVDLDIPGCIPNWGKGENSWDSGMDGVCGTSGQSLEDAVGNATKAALRNRQRYGGPHVLPQPMSVSEAEEFIAAKGR